MPMSEYLSIQEQREHAEHYLTLLDRKLELDFFKDGSCMVALDTGLGFIQAGRVEQFPDILEKKKEIEKRFNAVVYYITACDTNFGYMVNFLITSKYEEDIKNLCVKCSDNYYRVWSYVWNKDNDYLSEPGMIGVYSEGIMPLIRVN